MKYQKSFTLVEILVVATIISLLTAAVAISYTTIARSSRDARRKADLEQIRAALEMYRSNNNLYPTSNQVDVSCGSTAGLHDITNTYLKDIPQDPKCDAITYYYSSSDGSTYTLAAYLESGGATCISGQCGEKDCNYCLGPYGP